MFSIMVITRLLTGSCEVEGSCRSHVLRRGGGMLPSLLFPGGPSLSSAHPPTLLLEQAQLPPRAL